MKHARLSASSAHRWLTCPPIIALEELAGGEDKTSIYAREGTDAHALAEMKLQNFLGKRNKTAMKKWKKESEFFDEEMEEATDLYVDYVTEIFNSHSDLATMELEQKVRFDKWVPGGFGTSDVVIVSPEVIEIIDLKYGKGVKVDAYQNPQLMLYALGAYDKFDFIYDFKKVTMTIVQPRLDHMDSFTVDTEELLYWANNYVAPRSALADQGIGDWNITEDVMRFSNIRGRLRPQFEKNKELIEKYEYGEGALLSVEEIAEILKEAPQIKKWISDIENFALYSALDGEEIPGFKVVEGRSNRRIDKPEELAEKLIKEGFKEDEIYRPAQLETLGKLEKLVGKAEFSELAGDTVIKPQGKPAIVPNSDRRPAINDAQEDFKNY